MRLCMYLGVGQNTSAGVCTEEFPDLVGSDGVHL